MLLRPCLAPSPQLSRRTARSALPHYAVPRIKAAARTDTDIRKLASQAYAVRVLDALHGEIPAAIRQHDGEHLL